MEAGLPNITGSVSKLPQYDAWALSGAFARGTRSTNDGNLSPGTGLGELTFDASLSSSIYGPSATVTPLSLSSIFVIKH